MPKPKKAGRRARQGSGVDQTIVLFKKQLAVFERIMARRRPERALADFDEAAETIIAQAFGKTSAQLEAYEYAQTAEAAGIVNLPEEAQEDGARDVLRESLQQRRHILESCLATLQGRRASPQRSTPSTRGAARLPALRVADHMSTDVRSIHKDATIREAARLLQKWNVGSLLVDDGSRYIGIITDTDLSRKAVGKGLDANSTAVRSCMSKPIVSIEDSEPLEDAIALMKKKSIRHLAVTEDGTIIGVLSVADLLQAYGPVAGTRAKE